MRHLTTVLILTALLNTSCFNVFALLGHGNPDTYNSEERLVKMGQAYLNNMEYEMAYDAFSQALSINPDNSTAREGVATAYLFWRVPITNVINAIIQEDYALIGMNNLYDASRVVSDNLWYIINGSADGVIPALDNSINLNFFLFNTVYAAFMLIDSDSDGSILADYDDIYTVNPDFSFSNNLPNLSNFVEVVNLVFDIAQKTNQFEILYARSMLSLSNVEGGLSSSSALEILNGLKTPIQAIKAELDGLLAQFSGYDSISQFGLADPSDVTNLIYNQGYTNFNELYADLLEVGITNLDSVTNYFPDLLDFGSLLSNMYGLP